ncbi:MAG: hypothetical protein LAO21_16510 [Acidobacteriia bacterium]|nr:hypothetical protein [Terriglobia bacterium]
MDTKTAKIKFCLQRGFNLAELFRLLGVRIFRKNGHIDENGVFDFEWLKLIRWSVVVSQQHCQDVTKNLFGIGIGIYFDDQVYCLAGLVAHNEINLRDAAAAASPGKLLAQKQRQLLSVARDVITFDNLRRKDITPKPIQNRFNRSGLIHIFIGLTMRVSGERRQREAPT